MTKAKFIAPALVADAFHGQGGSYVRQPGSRVRQRLVATQASAWATVMPAPVSAPFADFPLSPAGRASTPKPQE